MGYGRPGTVVCRHSGPLIGFWYQDRIKAVDQSELRKWVRSSNGNLTSGLTAVWYRLILSHAGLDDIVETSWDDISPQHRVTRCVTSVLARLDLVAAGVDSSLCTGSTRSRSRWDISVESQALGQLHPGVSSLSLISADERRDHPTLPDTLISFDTGDWSNEWYQNVIGPVISSEQLQCLSELSTIDHINVVPGEEHGQHDGVEPRGVHGKQS